MLAFSRWTSQPPPPTILLRPTVQSSLAAKLLRYRLTPEWGPECEAELNAGKLQQQDYLSTRSNPPQQAESRGGASANYSFPA